MTVSIALALVAGAASSSIDTIPPYYTATEKWTCTFQGFGTNDKVTSYFGVYRSHVEDEFGSDNIIVQNDENALVFVDSSIGHEDGNGKILRSATVTTIEKKGMRRFKRSVIDLLDAPAERIGTCAPY
jgi:hypothetical protein